MNVLFVFYVPSGGMETVNRHRCRALRRYGIHAECLYFEWGAGIQNTSDITIHVTKDDAETKRILEAGNYHTIVVTTDHTSFERFRRLGFTGKLVLEIQGYGSRETARQELINAAPIIQANASALMNPNTQHIASLYKDLFPEIPQYNLNNCFDSEKFTYQATVKPLTQIIAWIGRIESNKNWREFLYIGHSLSFYYPDLQLWMFEDKNLSIPSERQQFIQLVDHLNLNHRLHLHSNVPNEEMMLHYSMIGESGGLMCSTSKVEGAPLSILEAMCCRCPVLATNSDGVTASVIHNVTGKRYAQGDIGQGIREARELIEDKELRSRIQDSALQHVKDHFSEESFCLKFIEMLHTI